MPFCSECGSPMSGESCAACWVAFVGDVDDEGHGGGYQDVYDGGYNGGYINGYNGGHAEGGGGRHTPYTPTYSTQGPRVNLRGVVEAPNSSSAPLAASTSSPPFLGMKLTRGGSDLGSRSPLAKNNSRAGSDTAAAKTAAGIRDSLGGGEGDDGGYHGGDSGGHAEGGGGRHTPYTPIYSTPGLWRVAGPAHSSSAPLSGTMGSSPFPSMKINRGGSDLGSRTPLAKKNSLTGSDKAAAKTAAGIKEALGGGASVLGGISGLARKARSATEVAAEPRRGQARANRAAKQRGVRAPNKSVYMVADATRNKDSPREDDSRSLLSMAHAVQKTFQDKNLDRLTKTVQEKSAKDFFSKTRDEYVGGSGGPGGGGGEGGDGGGGGGSGRGGRGRPPPGPKQGKALFDWTAESEIELDAMKLGDIVDIIEDDDPEWFLVSLGKEEGFVPRSYIAVLKASTRSVGSETQYIQDRRDRRKRTRTIIQGDPDSGVYFRMAESFHTKQGRERYICYAVLCKWAGVEWTIFRRFNQFYEFNLKAKRLGIAMPYPFPPKVAWKTKALLKEREKKLRLWIFGISESSEQWIKHKKRKAAVVKVFGPSQLGDVKKHAQSTMPFLIEL